VGSNPTPRAFLVVSYQNNKAKGPKNLSAEILPQMKRNIALTADNSNSNAEKTIIKPLTIK
jgi:hypothetical protein